MSFHFLQGFDLCLQCSPGRLCARLISICNSCLRKYTLYSCDEMRTLISDVINKVESEDKQELAHALNAFCER